MPDARDSTRGFPRLAEGLEFGPEESAGGTVIAFLPPDRYLEVSAQTARLLRLVNGQRDVPTLAGLASAELSMQVSSAAFLELLERSLVPRGLIRYGDPAPATAQPHARRRVFIPATAVAVIARTLGFLYRPPIVAIAVAASVVAQLWFFLAGSGPQAEVDAWLVRGWLMVIALYVTSMLAHEIGHATALQAHGVTPGPIGMTATRGAPRWSSDVTGIWKLRRRQRVVVDLGGVYLQSLFVGALIMVHGMLPRLLPGIVVAGTVAVVDAIILFALAPRGRSDGFWLAADLAGIRHPSVDRTPQGDRGSEQASDGRGALGAYAGLYSIVASAGFAGLFVWLAGRPGFDLRIMSTGSLDGRSFIALSFAVALEMLMLAGLTVSIWSGLAWLADAARSTDRARLRKHPGAGT